MKNTVSINTNFVILIALILIALGTYAALSLFSEPVERDLMSEFKNSQSVQTSPDMQKSDASVAPVDQLLGGLKQRLLAQPDDVDGWVLLSKSYFHLDRWEEAEEAFETARALGYTGNWQPLPRIDVFSNNAASSKSFDSSINFLDYKLKDSALQENPQVDDSASQSGASVSADLQLKVSLNPALQNELSPDSPVFIFVRAANKPGPPLAVVRKMVSELPLNIILNDSHAMLPGKTISTSENIIVGARISMTGNPERQSGDFEQLSNTISSNFSDTLELVIKDKI